MTTMHKLMLALVTALALGACGGDDTTSNGGGDLAMTGGGGDMAVAACSMNPMTNEELLNACTSAQTGDPNKDAPYFPSLAPNGQLPPLP